MTKRRADGTFLERAGPGGQTKMQIQARQKLKTWLAGAGDKIRSTMLPRYSTPTTLSHVRS